MAIEERSLKILEYNKIIEQLAHYAGSEEGRKKCLGLLPMTRFDDIKQAQQETRDALNRIYKKGSLSFNGVPNIWADIKLLEVGSSLLAVELLKISSVLSATLRVKSYGSAGDALEEGVEGDTLSERFELLEPCSVLNNEIMRCIISEDEIADDASPGLKTVRRQMGVINDRIREQLNKMINNKETQEMLQDNIITMRNGRFCLPVKSEHKNNFDGMVHDQSSKGSTIFIEPAAVVKLNNELAELFLQEKKEIEKILACLSAEAGEYTEQLKYDITTLTELDFIFAKATLAKSMKASEPVFNTNGYINIKKGRHPLIDQNKVVPIDVYVGNDFSMLIVTGPNTGGKTVTLKTVGLFTLMGQAGLHIPAYDGSKLSVFTNVFADIGDEQSIEQSLSTFSSHMKNIVHILKKADRRSLCLFDELGAGTDPTEGAALAMAILTKLHEDNIRVLATTHYAELKVFALTTPGVSNACCEFDIQTLQPTYRLLIGIPGKSNAFAISKKLGLKDEIIQMADSFIGSKDKSFEDVIADLDTRRIQLVQDEEKTAKLKEDAEKFKQRYFEKHERLEASKDKILRDAKEQAREIIEEAKEYADEAIRRINKLGESVSMKELEAERAGLREEMGKHSWSIQDNAPKKKANVDKNVTYLVGDVVRLLKLGITGTLLTVPNEKGDMTVKAGPMQTKVNIADVEWVQHAEKDHSNGKVSVKAATGAAKAMLIHPDINLVGKRVDEALPLLDKYLDDAYLAHMEKVTVIHGRGTGALKEAVHQHLKRTKYVKEYHLGAFGEGDQGVTIVTFK